MYKEDLSYLNALEPRDISKILRDELNQTVAFVLSQISADVAALVLDEFTIDRQQDIINRIKNLQHISPDVTRQISHAIRHVLSSPQQKINGEDVASNILACMKL